MPWPAIAIAAGAALNAASNNRNVNKQIDAARREAELARNHNLYTMHLQNKYNVDFWNKNNQYNLPSNQVQRLRDAGLNPDLMYENGTSGLVSMGAPQSASSHASPVADTSAYSNMRSPLGEVLNSLKESQMLEAQKKLIDAQTKKTLADAEGTEKSNKYIDSLSEGQIALNSATLKNLESVLSLNEAQKTKLNAEIGKIDVEIDSLKQSIEESMSRVQNIDFEQFMSRLEFTLKSQHVQASISKMAADEGLTRLQAKQIAETLPHMVRQMVLNNGKIAIDYQHNKIKKDSDAIDFYFKNGEFQIVTGIDKVTGVEKSAVYFNFAKKIWENTIGAKIGETKESFKAIFGKSLTP